MLQGLLLTLYLIGIAVLRGLRARKLRRLHTELLSSGDPHALAWQLAFVEFPFMFEAGTSLGFFSTFAVPTIAGVLRSTRGFECACQVRYDDTMLLMHEIGEFGCRSERGKAAIQRVNSIHARTPGIRQEDMLYTLWVFCFDPVFWVNAYEWRKLEDFEVNALYRFWREVGESLGITEIPPTCEEFLAWGQAYEAKQFRPTQASKQLTFDVINLAATWGPKWLPSFEIVRACKRQVVFWLLCALGRNPQLLDAIGLREERLRMPTAIRAFIYVAVVARGYLNRFLLPPRPDRLAATICGQPVESQAAHTQGSKRQQMQSAGVNLDEVAYKCPFVAKSYRDGGLYRLKDLGHPVGTKA